MNIKKGIKKKPSLLLLAVSGSLLYVCYQLLALPIPEPTNNAQEITSHIAKLLPIKHFSRKKINDELATDFYNNYLDLLDYSHMYFTQEELAEFENLKLQLDDLVLEGNVNPAYNIYRVLAKNIEARIKWVHARLEDPFDFTTDETYQPDRHKLEWPENKEEADKLWELRLKSEMLSEVLKEKEPEEALKNIKRRYKRMIKNLEEREGTDILKIYLNALAHCYDPHSEYLSPDSD